VYSGGTIAMGVAGLLVALWVFPVRLILPSRAVLKRELVDGWHLFVSRMSVSLYTTSNTVILGLFASNTVVAYYVAGEKIVRAIQGLQFPLAQAVFPHIGRLAAESKTAALAFASRMTRIVGAVTLVMSAGLFLAAGPLTRVVLGEQFGDSVLVVRILSLLPFLGNLSHILSIQVMVNFGLKRTLTRILAMAGVANIVLVFALVGLWQHIGVCIAVLLTEAGITAAMYVALRRRGLDVFRRYPTREAEDGV